MRAVARAVVRAAVGVPRRAAVAAAGAAALHLRQRARAVVVERRPLAAAIAEPSARTRARGAQAATTDSCFPSTSAPGGDERRMRRAALAPAGDAAALRPPAPPRARHQHPQTASPHAFSGFRRQETPGWRRRGGRSGHAFERRGGVAASRLPLRGRALPARRVSAAAAATARPSGRAARPPGRAHPAAQTGSTAQTATRRPGSDLPRLASRRRAPAAGGGGSADGGEAPVLARARVQRLRRRPPRAADAQVLQAAVLQRRARGGRRGGGRRGVGVGVSVDHRRGDGIRLSRLRRDRRLHVGEAARA